MWRIVLPLTLSFCSSLALGQSSQSSPDPVATQSAKTQPKAALTQVVANDIAPAVTWDDPHQKLERAVIVNAIMERQLALRRDTEKLLFLAEQLKQNVDKSGPNILSMDVIKKAQEIEKLAKSVKDKMREAY